MPAPSPIKKGLTTCVWGTMYGASSASAIGITGFIIDSGVVRPINDGPVGVIENGDGARVAKIYLDDGFEADVEGVYDTALTYPAVGDTVTFLVPKYGAAGGTQSFNCTLESVAPKIGRKKEAMIAFKLSYNAGVVA